MIHSFGHLDGYSALYYTYMWSLVIAKDIFAEIESGETAAKQIKLAKKYMKDILMPGGSKSADTAMVENFLGRPFNAERFEVWLKKDERLSPQIWNSSHRSRGMGDRPSQRPATDRWTYKPDLPAQYG